MKDENKEFIESILEHSRIDIPEPRLPRSQTIHLRAANEAEPEGIEGTGEYGDE